VALSQRRMFHQDELVRNYLERASQQYADLRVQQHRQSDELERFLSPNARTNETQGPSATRTMQVPRSTATFERKNTLLLTGKSKFYTMSYEDHCRTPSPTRDQRSNATKQYHTIATDDLSSDRVEYKVKPVGVKSSVNTSSKSAVENYVTSTRGETPSFHVVQPSNEDPHNWSFADTNHNSIFWPGQTQCLGAENCPHPVLPHTGNLCAACFQAKRYSSIVHYPTAMTKL